MRGSFQDQGVLFSYVSAESRVPQQHPLRRIRQLVRDVLKQLSPSLSRLYAREGRPSVPPEQLLSALLLHLLYSIHSERQLIEQLNYNLLYRWFVGLSPDDPVWDATTMCMDPPDQAESRRVKRDLRPYITWSQSRTLLRFFKLLGRK
jgi:transposase